MQQITISLLLFLSAALLAAAAAATALPETALAGSIEEIIDTEMPASGVPGLAYAVVADGEIVLLGARGVVEVGSDRQVTPHTPFLIGSISKSFTAMAVMQLVEAGKVDLDSGIARYLDDFSARPAGAITVRQLLSHTSGLTTMQGNVLHAGATGGKDELARRVGELASLSPAFEPGERWEYSNANYKILGRLIEVVSGQEFQTYVEASILAPLGMEDSFVSDGEVHEEMATGHRPWFGTRRPRLGRPTSRAAAPQGGVVASASDLARYMQMMMNGEDDLLSAEDKALMTRPASDASPFYGLGWFVDTRDGAVWHSGTSPGVETIATMLPAEGKAVVVLVNGGSGVGFGETNQLRNSITAAALGHAYDGEGSRWPQKALFIALVLLPLIYVLGMVWAWLGRARLRAKLRMGVFGLFSLWFPLLTTLAAAWFILDIVPRLFGEPLDTMRLYQPDLALVLVATAVTGLLWAVFRLGVAYSGAFSND